MTEQRRRTTPGGTPLFPSLPASRCPEQAIKQAAHPVWTENKARLIERYLYYFVLITRHGTYIDGFAGPQTPSKPDTWAAKLVLESRPGWLRHFYLFEKKPAKVELLRVLRAQHPERDIQIYEGDSNVGIKELLKSRRIPQREAAFCLLDQWTFECRWETVRALAEYKRAGLPKIEVFYFLANRWLDRALAGSKTAAGTEQIEAWWGGSGGERLRKMNAWERAAKFAERFRRELGYQSSKPWPIYERKHGGGLMYFMIHATDHLEAPLLMARAYAKTVDPREPLEQLALDIGMPAVKV